MIRLTDELPYFQVKVSIRPGRGFQLGNEVVHGAAASALAMAALAAS